MSVEYQQASSIAVVKGVATNSQLANVVKFYTGSVTYDDEPSSKYATVTVSGKTQRVMLCIAVSGTVAYDDSPCLYSTVSGHRCLNITEPTATETPDDIPNAITTLTISGKNYPAIRCILINKTPTYDGVSSTCTFTDDNGKIHTAQLVNQVGSGSIEKIVKGVPPLTLDDAIAGGLQYVKAFGGTEQRNLPDGYLQRQFIYMMDGSYLDTGIVPDNTGKIEIDFQTTSLQTRNSLYLGTRSSASTGAGISVAHTNSGDAVFDAFGQRFTPTQTFASNTRYLISYDNGTIVWKSGSTVIYTNTTTPTDTTTHSLYINALNNEGTVYGNYEGIYLYSFKVWNGQGVLVADYVPAVQKGTVPVVGFYDTVSGTFKTATAGTFAAGGEAVPTPDAPMDIICNNGALRVDANGDVYTDGTVETINVLGKNLFNWHIGLKSLNDTTTVWQIVYGGVTMELNQSTGQFTVTGLSSGAGGRNSLRTQTFSLPAGTYTISATNNPTINILLVEETGGTTIAQTQDTTTFTLTETTPLHFGLGREQGTTYDDSFYLQIEQGSPATEYVPYNNSTATCEDLLSVGNYTDEQEIISGAVTRKVGVKVLTGEESGTWTTSNNVARKPLADVGMSDALSGENPSSTHFKGMSYTPSQSADNGIFITSGGVFGFSISAIGSTDAAIDAWLADQYAAGTPVIVIYPLATETTDTVTGQPMNTVQGDNTLEITQASLNNLEVEVKYEQ